MTIEGVSQSSCKFPSNPQRKGECSTLQSNLLERIEERAKSGDVVVVSNRFKIPDWWRTPIVDKWLAQSEVVGTINRLAEELSSRGAHVVLMMPTPEFRFDVHLCSPQWFRPKNLDRCSISRATLAARRAPVTQLIDRAISPKVIRFDAMSALCDEQRCSQLDDDDMPLYRDTNHLSRLGVQRLQSTFGTLIARLIGRDK